MDKTTFDGLIKVTASQTHPLQSHVDFIFTDFLPNKNKQGVRETESQNIISTGVDMPIKANFNRGKLNDHDFTVPVGHITDMVQRDSDVVGHGILYKDEFPDLITHLEKASASENGVHFSWELYHGGKVIEDDVTWLTNVVVAGVAIVAHPAYSGRTPLLAMAGIDDMLEEKVNELERQVATLTEQLSHSGSSNSMDPMEEMKQRLDALDAQVVELGKRETPETNQETETPDVAALTSELNELRSFKQDVEKQQARAALLTARRTPLKDVLSDDEFAAKSDFIAGLDEDQFKTYTETLASVAQKGKQSSSDRSRSMPIPDSIVSNGTNGVSIKELAKAMKERK